MVRETDGDGKLLTGEIFLTNPSCSHNKKSDHFRSSERIFFQWNKLYSTAPFTQGLLFPSKSGVNQSKHAERRAVIWLSFSNLLLLHARSSKSQVRSVPVICHPRDQA